MKYISQEIQISKQEKSKYKEKFVPAGQTTQLIVGATPESDLQIMKLSESLYQNFHLKRVYYSAYVSVNQDSNLPTLSSPPLLRENRLYQADWLLRFYGFKMDDLLDETHPNFHSLLDPKCDWALRNLHLFPVEINKADYQTLLKVPGIGVVSAKRIIKARREFHLTFENLKKLGIVLKRARYFITCDGKYFDAIKSFHSNFISENLLFLERVSSGSSNYVQTSLFDTLDAPLPMSSSNHSLEWNQTLFSKNLNSSASPFETFMPTKEDKQKCLTGML